MAIYNNEEDPNVTAWENHIREREIEFEDTHNKLRNILKDYGNPEWGDCIIDEICFLFGYPTTTDL